MAQLVGNEYLDFIIPVQLNGQPSSVPQTHTVAKIAGVLTDVNATQVDIASTTTLATVAAFSSQLMAGNTYAFHGAFPVASNSSGGIKLAVSGDGVLNASSFEVTGKFFSAGGVAVSNTTTLGGGIGSTATVILAEVCGAIVVTTTGNILIQAAQNASTSATSSLLANGFFRCLRVT